MRRIFPLENPFSEWSIPRARRVEAGLKEEESIEDDGTEFHKLSLGLVKEWGGEGG